MQFLFLPSSNFILYVNFLLRQRNLIKHFIKDHPYITSAKGLGWWGQKMAVFSDVQYCIYADNHSGWVGQKKSKNMLT